jgi:O-antigen/teichoic acid export membrane protein
MVEASRDPKRVASIAGNSCRFLLLLSISLCLGSAAIMQSAVGVVYGPRYHGAVPALIIATLLCIPRAFQWLPETLLRTADRQNRLILWYGITGVVNMTLDFILIPKYGAVGAAWGNGLSQVFSVFAIWFQARQFFQFSLPKLATLRIGLAGIVMAAIAYFISHRIPHLPGLILAIAAAAASYVGLLRLFGGLEPGDRERLAPIGNRLPGPARRLFLAAVSFATAA